MQHSTRRIPVLVSLSLVFGVCCPSHAGETKAEEALGALNALARDAYKQARAAFLEKNKPVIVYDQEKLVLLRDKERLEAPLDLDALSPSQGGGPCAHGPVSPAQASRRWQTFRRSAWPSCLKLCPVILAAAKSLDKHFKADELDAQNETIPPAQASPFWTPW